MVNSTSSGSASARKPTWPRLTPSSGVPHSRASSAARRIVPSPPITTTTSQSAAAPAWGLTTSTSGRSSASSAASSSSSRSLMPFLVRPTAELHGRRRCASSPPGVGDDEHTTVLRLGRPGWSRVTPSHRQPPGPRSDVPRRGSRAASTCGSCRRSQRKYSTLPDGPGSGLVVTDRAPQPRRAAASATAVTASARSSGSRTTPPLADPVLAHLELRLHHQREVAVGPGDAQQRVEHQPERDERQVADDQVDRPADQLGGELADVGAVVDDARGRRCAAPRRAGRSRRRPRPPRAAPARSSTSVKPPVEAPASRQRRPRTSRPSGSNAASAPASLWPPRET